MFNDKYGLTEAVLNGSKTMTRRSTQKLQCLSDLVDCGYTPEIRGENIIASNGNDFVVVCKLPYKIGEVVAIAQSYKDCGEFDVYKAHKDTPGWTNKMFVRADSMPHQIKITGIRIERLQDISDEDCMKEGIIKSLWAINPSTGNKLYTYRIRKEDTVEYFTPCHAFNILIDEISGKGTWKSNPYVWVYDYKLVK